MKAETKILIDYLFKKSILLDYEFFGVCIPTHNRLIIFNDGTLLYEYNSKEGSRKLSKEEHLELFNKLKEINFSGLKEKYSNERAKGGGTHIVTVRRGEDRKTVTFNNEFPSDECSAFLQWLIGLIR